MAVVALLSVLAADPTSDGPEPAPASLPTPSALDQEPRPQPVPTLPAVQLQPGPHAAPDPYPPSALDQLVRDFDQALQRAEACGALSEASHDDLHGIQTEALRVAETGDAGDAEAQARLVEAYYSGLLDALDKAGCD